MFEDGTIGVAFALLALWRTDWSEPFAAGQATPGIAYSIGQTYEDREKVSRELRLTYLSPRKIGPVQVTWDASLTSKGGIYGGVGGHMEQEFHIGPVPAFVGISALVGLWNPSNDVDLGFPIEFRTDLEVGVEIWDNARISIVSDHRSHARLAKLAGGSNFRNKGMESIALRFTQQF